MVCCGDGLVAAKTTSKKNVAITGLCDVVGMVCALLLLACGVVIFEQRAIFS